MKMCSIVGLILLSILVAPLAAMAATTTIDDSSGGANTYWGGLTYSGAGGPPPTQPSTQDVILGDVLGKSWAINSMVVTDDGTNVSVKVIGPWFDSVNHNNAGNITSSGDGNSGDLYLSSSGWNHNSDTPHFASDTFNSGEKWDYVVGYSPYVPGQTKVLGVYKLDFSTLNMTLPTNAYADGRGFQAYWGGEAKFVESASILYDGSSGDNSSLTFTFAESAFAGDDLGLHWTMYCGNDVVEGEAQLQVPEPGSLLLLGLGLAGLALWTRKNRFAKRA